MKLHKENKLLEEELLENEEEEVSGEQYLLAKAGPAFVLPLHTGDEGESYLKQMRTFVQNGSVANGVLVNQADAIFFVEEVTAIQGP